MSTRQKFYFKTYAKQANPKFFFSILIFSFLFTASALCEEASSELHFLSKDKRIRFSHPPLWKVIEPDDVNMDCIILPENTSFEDGKQAIVLKIYEPAATFDIDYKVWEGFVHGIVSHYIPNTNINVSKAPESNKQDLATKFSCDTQDGKSVRGFMYIQKAQHRQILLYARYPSEQPLGALECYELIRKTLSVKERIKTDTLNATLSEAKKRVIIKDVFDSLKGLQEAARSAGQNISSHNIQEVDIVNNDGTLEIRTVVSLTDNSTKKLVPVVNESFKEMASGKEERFPSDVNQREYYALNFLLGAMHGIIHTRSSMNNAPLMQVVTIFLDTQNLPIVTTTINGKDLEKVFARNDLNLFYKAMKFEMPLEKLKN